MIDVSVIIPVYNVEKYMEHSVEMVLNQTHRNIEVILVDDGSTDGSGALCDMLAQRDSRVKVIHKKNAGVGFARNSGMEIAAGEYLYFCDPDDETDPYLIEDNIKLAKEHRADIVVFGYDTVYYDAQGNLQDKNRRSLPKLSGAYDYRGFQEHFREECGLEYSLACRLYRREYIEQNHIRQSDQRTGEDALFIFETYRTPFRCIVYNQKSYYIYARRSGTATTTFHPIRFAHEYNVSCSFERVVESMPFIDGRYQDMVDRKYIMGLSMALGNLARAGKTLTMKEKKRMVKEALQNERLKKALKDVRMRIFGLSSTGIKVLLLKLRQYSLVIWLGEAKVKKEQGA